MCIRDRCVVTDCGNSNKHRFATLGGGSGSLSTLIAPAPSMTTLYTPSPLHRYVARIVAAATILVYMCSAVIYENSPGVLLAGRKTEHFTAVRAAGID